MSFSHAHSHAGGGGHGHSHESHGHSHGGHGHAHGGQTEPSPSSSIVHNTNMEGAPPTVVKRPDILYEPVFFAVV